MRIKAQKDAEKESRRIAKDKAVHHHPFPTSFRVGAHLLTLLTRSTQTAEKLEKKAKKDAADAEKKAKAEKEQAVSSRCVSRDGSF